MSGDDLEPDRGHRRRLQCDTYPVNEAAASTAAGPRVALVERPSARDVQAIFRGLSATTERVAGPARIYPLAVLLANEEGAVVGGLLGRTVYGWLVIEMLYVPEPLRGRAFGTALMREAEAEARRRGCIGVQVDTFGFQAPAFYRRLGFSVFGELKDNPPGETRLFMAKRLDRAARDHAKAGQAWA